MNKTPEGFEPLFEIAFDENTKRFACNVKQEDGKFDPKILMQALGCGVVFISQSLKKHALPEKEYQEIVDTVMNIVYQSAMSYTFQGVVENEQTS